MTSCTCVIENGELKSLCDLHRAETIKAHNRAIETACKLLVNQGVDVWLVKKVRELMLKEG